MHGVSSLGNRQTWAFPLITLLVVVADQLSKLWIRLNLLPGQSLPEEGTLRLTYVTNKGVAFGLPLELPLAFSILLIVVILFLVYRYSNTLLLVIASALLLGGTIGNLIDRLRFGGVIDFIDIHLFGDFHWPAFNLADSALVIGVILLAYAFWQPKRRLKPS